MMFLWELIMREAPLMMVIIVQNFGVEVLGLDLSDNMVDIAMEKAVTEKLPSVRLSILILCWLDLKLWWFV